MAVKDIILSDLEASKSALLIQKLTISYTYLRKMPEEAIMGLTTMMDGFKNNNTTESIGSALADVKSRVGATVGEVKNQVERDAEQIEKDTLRFREQKEASLKNKEAQMAANTNHANALQNKQKEDANKEDEIQKQFLLESLIEL